ncbi:MAG: hypothetical protein JXQ71_01630 [Verrucomicrobia bacterium]|nr:hypothetical protein [Verrucomicrobiota bacterium]
MTTKPASRQKRKKLPVDWDTALEFRVDPRVVAAGKRRLLKHCTIAISTRQPPNRPAVRAAPAEA